LSTNIAEFRYFHPVSNVTDFETAMIAVFFAVFGDYLNICRKKKGFKSFQ